VLAALQSAPQQTHSKRATAFPVRSGLVLQRKCACRGSSAGECEECKKKEVRRKAAGAAGSALAPPIVHEVLSSPGQPLDAQTRSFFEPRFGHDFSKVRVHTDHKAVESARSVHARAYTLGSHIAFDHDQYCPATLHGRNLLAHELTHVVQQFSAPQLSPQNLEIGPASDAAEQQANEVSRQMTDSSRARGASPGQAGAIKLRRQPAGGGSGEEEPKKEARPLIQVGDYKLDVKPLFPDLPLSLPSVDDVNQAINKPKEKGKDMSCPKGFTKLKTGDCCPGTFVEGPNCCPPIQMTANGVCCPVGQMPDDRKNECVPAPQLPIPGKVNLHGKLPARAPLTVDLPIHFKQGLPAATAGEKALRASLTAGGQSELDTVIRFLRTNVNFSAQLTGMASIEGTPAQNDQLGLNRVRSVATVLEANGMATFRFTDPPALPTSCPSVGDGLHNCGDTMAAKSMNANDRQVMVRMFIVPEEPEITQSGKVFERDWRKRL